MRLGILIILFLVYLSCNNKIESKSKPSKSEGVELLPEQDKAEKENYLKNLNLTSLLKNPINLQKFKKSKNSDCTTSSIRSGTGYYFKPKITNSILYSYNYPVEKFTDHKSINQMVVFKYGKNKHKYEDETEILIELRIFNKDLDLGKANLVGLAKTKLESEFGVNYRNFKNGIIYSDKNKVLIFELENSKVKSYRYMKLNTENINRDLVEKITK